MPKPLVPKFRPDLLARLKDITEKRVPAKLKPIVGKVLGASAFAGEVMLTCLINEQL